MKKLLNFNLKISCFNCGNRVPFWGETCPFCGQEKTSCQAVRLVSVTCIVAGLIIGLVLRGMLGFFIGGLIGLLVFAVIEKAAVFLAPKPR